MAGVESRKEVVVAAPKGALFAKSPFRRPADLSSSAQGICVSGLGSILSGTSHTTIHRIAIHQTVHGGSNNGFLDKFSISTPLLGRQSQDITYGRL